MLVSRAPLERAFVSQGLVKGTPAARLPTVGVPAGYAMLEVLIASVLLGVAASASLGATLLAQREASLAVLRQNAIALAAEQLEWAATGAEGDTAAWQARVAAALPGGEGSLAGTPGAPRVSVRWRAVGVDDTRCPGSGCVVLGGAP